jgi:hypothetical protein
VFFLFGWRALFFVGGVRVFFVVCAAARQTSPPLPSSPTDNENNTNPNPNRRCPSSPTSSPAASMSWRTCTRWAARRR